MYGGHRVAVKRFQRSGFLRTVASGVLGGMVAGVGVAACTWFYEGTVPDGGLDFGSVGGAGGLVTTIAHMAVAHAVLGLIVGFIIGFFALVLRRFPIVALPGAVAAALSVGLYGFVTAFVRRNLALPAYVSLGDPMRAEVLRSSALVGALAGVIALVAALFAFSSFRSRAVRRVLTFMLLLFVAVSGIRLVAWNVGGADYRRIETTDWSIPATDGKVVLIGLDGATWQVLDKYSGEGLLPNIDEMRKSGASANLMTHGRRISPAVWTGVATGWSHAEHGITGFTMPEQRTGRTREVQSFDRRKPALWQILTEMGKTTAVVNWWASYPAESTNGLVISRIVEMDSLSVSPSALVPRMAAIVDSSKVAGELQGEFIGGSSAVFDLTEAVLHRGQPDLLMTYVQATDKAQHKYWAAYEPEQFGGEWGLTEDYLASGEDVLRNLWADVDRRVGRILDLAEDGTDFIIVSDHGFKPRSAMLALFRPNRLLEAMGYLEYEDTERTRIDFAKTRAFAAGLDAGDAMLGIYVNTIGIHDHGVVPPDSAYTVARRLVRELSALRVEETGEPLFLSAGLVQEEGTERLRKLGYDVFAAKAGTVRRSSVNSSIVVGDVRSRLNDFLKVYEDNTGNHSPRGVLLAYGPSFRRGAIVPLIADSPYSTALAYVTGYIGKLEPLYRFLRKAGVLDPYTSIDVAPTVLYLLGLPASADMEGRLMERVVAPRLLDRRPATLIPSFDHIRPSVIAPRAGTLSEETLRQLRALGYIQ